MHCPLCAEEIKDAAILCRFCGARKEGETWLTPQPAAPPVARAQPAAPPGQFTMRFAAVCFLLSGAYELISVTTSVPLLGAMRSGLAGASYHLVYLALFTAMGLGLWTGRPWGYPAVLGATAVYTLDKLLYMSDHELLEIQVAEATQAYAGLLNGLVSDSMLVDSLRTASLVSLVCWWGFTLFVVLRRGYFQPDAPITAADEPPPARAG